MFSARPRRDHPSTSTTSAVGLCSAPRALLSSVTSSLWVPGLYQHRRRPAHSVAPSSVLSGALQRIFRQAGVRPPFNVLCKSPGGALRASFLVPQCYFLIVGVGPASTPPADRALFRVLSACGRFIRCTAACSLPSRGEAALPGPLQVHWGPAPCLVPHSPALLPRCGCRACAGIAGSLLTPLRPQHTRALYPVYCSVFSARPRRGCSSMSSTSPPGLYSVPRSLFTSVASSLWVLGPHRQRGGPRTPSHPQRTRALYPMHCSVFSAHPGGDRPSMTSTVPLGVRSVPRSLFPSVTSLLWAPGRHRHRR
ncbi:hypothetical protein NDU88_011531 [Pleurodeles waltl]|uniref:Uncharacterized protein n=1 Tax=Pleurodeles waltl TaxID=8319 RepID=A0AAV7S407_PLEWA|nr:hypothetical protein NDU88_011531 [Pleurodeles waltl]